jgi:hypothetical protein
MINRPQLQKEPPLHFGVARYTCSLTTMSSTARSDSYIVRPWTARSSGHPTIPQSRPGTARPQTAASTKRDASYVLAVLEGRGVGKEVGIAALDKDTGRVNLIQVRFLDSMRVYLLRRSTIPSCQTCHHTSRHFTRCIFTFPL